MAIQSNVPRPGLDLQYPLSLGVYDKYEQAQHVVDYLSDHEFQVQNMAIVGTELRSVERITGRLTRGKIAAASAFSGAWFGLFIGLAFALFGGASSGDAVGFVITVVIFGAVFGAIWSQVSFAAVTRSGTRDFSSVTQVVATKYEVLVEHTVAEQAREMLASMPGAQLPGAQQPGFGQGYGQGYGGPQNY